MSEIETLSHVDLLDRAFTHVNKVGYCPDLACCNDARAEILRRMQACTRDDIPMHPSEYQR